MNQALNDVLTAAIKAGEEATLRGNNPQPASAALPGERPEFIPDASAFGIDLAAKPLVEAIHFGNELAGATADIRMGLDTILSGLLNTLEDRNEKLQKYAGKTAAILNLSLQDRNALKELHEPSTITRSKLNQRLLRLVETVSAKLTPELQPAVPEIMASLLDKLPSGNISVKEAAEIHRYAPNANGAAFKRLTEALTQGRQDIREASRTIVASLRDATYEQVEIDQGVAAFSEDLNGSYRADHPYNDKLREIGIDPGNMDTALVSFLQKLTPEEFRISTTLLVREATGKDNIETIVADIENLLVEYGGYQGVLASVEAEANETHEKINNLALVAKGVMEGKEPSTPQEKEIADLIKGTLNLQGKINADLTSPAMMRILNESNPKNETPSRMERVDMLLSLPKGSVATAFLPLKDSVLRDKRDPNEIMIQEIANSLQGRYPEKFDEGRLGQGLTALWSLKKEVNGMIQSLNEFNEQNPEASIDETPGRLLATCSELIERSLVPFTKAQGSITVFEFIASDSVKNGLPAYERTAVSLLMRENGHPMGESVRKNATKVLADWNDAIGNRGIYEANMEDGEKGTFNRSVSSIQKNRNRMQDILSLRKNNLEELVKAINPEDPDHVARTLHYRTTRQGDALQTALEYSEEVRAQATENKERISRVDSILDHRKANELREIAGSDPDTRAEFGKGVHARLQEEIKHSNERFSQDVTGFTEAFQLQRVGSLLDDNQYDLGTLVAQLETFRLDYRRRQDELDDSLQIADSEVNFLKSLQLGKENDQTPVGKDEFNSLGRALNLAFQKMEMETDNSSRNMSRSQLLQTVEAAKLSRKIEKAASNVEKRARNIFGKSADGKTPSPSTLVRVVTAVALRYVTHDKSGPMTGSSKLLESMPNTVKKTFEKYMSYRNEANMASNISGKLMDGPSEKKDSQKKEEPTV